MRRIAQRILMTTLGCVLIAACNQPTPTLHQAVMDQDPQTVARALELGANPNERWTHTQPGHSGATLHYSPLELAVTRSDEHIIRLLIAGGADLYAVNANNMTPFEWAIRFDRPEHARLLWTLSDQTTYRQHASNALRLADAGKQPDTFQWLLDEVADEEAIGGLFEFWASWDSEGRDQGLAKIQELLDRGLSPSQKALAAAVGARNVGITEVLLNTGLDIDGEANALPPLHHAVINYWDTTIAAFLLARGADPDVLDPWGRTPAMTIVRVRGFNGKSTEMLRDDLERKVLPALILLRSHGADLTIQDPEGRTFVDYVDGIDYTIKDPEGRTVGDYVPPPADPDAEYSKARLQSLLHSTGF